MSAKRYIDRYDLHPIIRYYSSMLVVNHCHGHVILMVLITINIDYSPNVEFTLVTVIGPPLTGNPISGSYSVVAAPTL